MSYVTMLKFQVENSKILKKSKYIFVNQTKKIKKNGFFDGDGCSLKFDVDYLDITFFEIFIENLKIKVVRSYPQEKSKATYNNSIYVFKTTDGDTKPETEEKEVEDKHDHCRKLTKGEISLSKIIFKDSINYNKVMVHKHGYPGFLGFQDDQTAVTPNGDIYFTRKRFKTDFSQDQDFIQRHWIVHEMVHVWQYQLGYNIIRHALDRIYDYNLVNKNDISEFYMEQQGDIIADYCMYLAGYSAEGLRQLKNKEIPKDFLLRYQNDISRTGRYDLPDHQRILSRFLKNPKNKDLLPKV